MSNLVSETDIYLATGQGKLNIIEELITGASEDEIFTALQMLIKDPKIKEESVRRQFLATFIERAEVSPIFDKRKDELDKFLKENGLVYKNSSIQLLQRREAEVVAGASAGAGAGPGPGPAAAAGAGDFMQQEPPAAGENEEIKTIQAFAKLPNTKKLFRATPKPVFDAAAQQVLKIAVESKSLVNAAYALRTVFQRYSDDGRPRLGMFNVFHALVQRPDLWANFNSTFGEFSKYWGGDERSRETKSDSTSREKHEFYTFLSMAHQLAAGMKLPQDMDPYVKTFFIAQLYGHIRATVQGIPPRFSIPSSVLDIIQEKVNKMGPNLFAEYSRDAAKEFGKRQGDVDRITKFIRVQLKKVGQSNLDKEKDERGERDVHRREQLRLRGVRVPATPSEAAAGAGADASSGSKDDETPTPGAPGSAP